MDFCSANLLSYFQNSTALHRHTILPQISTLILLPAGICNVAFTQSSTFITRQAFGSANFVAS